MFNGILSTFFPASRNSLTAGTILLAAAFGIAQPTCASTMTGQVTLDWTTFSVPPLDIGYGLPQLTWTSRSDDTSANHSGYYWNPPITDHASDWTTGAISTISQGNSKYSATTGSSTAATALSTASTLTMPAPDYLYAGYSSYSQRNGRFTVDGTGILLFQVEYSTAAQSDTARYGWSTPETHLTVNSFGGNEGSGSSSSIFSRTLYNSSTGPVSLNEAGVLQVAMLFKNGWSGSLQAQTSLSVYVSGGSGGGGEPVPVPPAIWLLGSALGVLSRRYRRTATPWSC